MLVRWRLTAATCHLLGELSWWTGEARSMVTARLLAEALVVLENQRLPSPQLVHRDGLRAVVQLRLPHVLLVDLHRHSARSGWSVELLVEALASQYLTGYLGLYARRRTAPLMDLGTATPPPGSGSQAGLGWSS